MGEKKKNLKSQNKGKTNNKIIELKFGAEDPLDQELDELLQEDLMGEADELEEQLMKDPDLMGIGASDDLFQKIVGELKEKGIWEEDAGDEGAGEPEAEDKVPDLETLYAMMPEADRRALETGRRVEQEQEALRQKKIHRKKVMNRMVKRGGTVAAVLVLVFGVSMTSDANRRLVSQMWDAVALNLGLRVTTNYIEEEKVIRSRTKEELEDFQKVSDELGIPGIDLGYLPDGMDYLRCEIDQMGGSAMMFYSYQDTIFRLSMIKKDDEGVDYYAIDNETQLSSIYTIAQEIEVKLGAANTENGIETYVAQIEYKDCNYILNGMVSLEEMEKIVKNIYFL